ncbi:glycosyltransferase [Brevibacillus sp. 179-C9.3 HS]|uniref:tetratricopeptide repeat-containing glycosyltransferase family 2 protein n=1 Tax=unclassified Brevibacillus TaxID=2684853 RepID=UPI0039A196C3
MKIAACIITKNEEKNLPVCLDSVKSIVSEMIVVDTGSEDGTVEVAKKYGAKVFFYDWVDDFAAARNFAIEQTKADWIIFLDADEYFSPDCVKYVVGAIAEAEQKKMDMIICMMSNIEKQTGKIISTNLHIRIFRNHPQIRYVGAIHERIVRLDSPAQALDVQQDITIIHTGYSEENLHSQEKGKRNLEILFKELDKRPDSFDILYYISESYLVDNKFEEALDFALRAQQYQNSDLKGVYENNYVNIFRCFIHLSKPKVALLQKMQEAIKAFPKHPDFYLYLGDFYKKENRYLDAIEAYLTGLKLMEQTTIVQSGVFATTVKVLDTVGHLYSKLKDWNKAVNYHVQALQVDKYLYSSLVNLMKILGRFEKSDSIITFLIKLYDVKNKKDCLYILKASLETNNTTIAGHILTLLQGDASELKEFKALYLFLSGNYSDSFTMFDELYYEHKKIEHAYGAICAAWRRNDHNGLIQLGESYANEQDLSEITLKIIGDHSSVQIDKKKMYSFLIHVCGVLKITEYKALGQITRDNQLLLEMGNYLYYEEEYLEAYYFYNEYLEQEAAAPEELLADLSYKVGDCLLQCGQNEYAWLFLQKAFTIAPEDYRIYGPIIEVAKLISRQKDVYTMLEKAIELYPDSNFLAVQKEELS